MDFKDLNTSFSEAKKPEREPMEGARVTEYKEFLRFVADKSGIVSYNQMLILWPAISSAMMEWMIRNNKSVDFGFAIIHPSPLRANWKQVMLSWFPTLGSTFIGKGPSKREAILELVNFQNRLLKSELLSIVSDRLVPVGIEVELKRSWWRHTLREELHHYNSIGAVAYAKRVARKIRDLQKKLTASYFSWLRQISFPCGKVNRGTSANADTLVPNIPEGKVRAARFENIPVHVVVPRKSEDVVRTLESVGQEDSFLLQELSDLQSDSEDLWKSRERIDFE